MRADPSRSRPPRPAAQHAAQHGAQHGARAVELEDWLNRRLYHPASWRLAKILARTPVTPNAVSVMAGACVVGAAMLYAVSIAPAALWGALGLMMGWHVVDGADGDLARMTGRVSELGEIIDGASDYLSHFVLYGVLAVIAAREWGAPGAVLIVLSAAARMVQAIFYETQRRQYLWWIYDRPWLRITAPTLPASTQPASTQPASTQPAPTQPAPTQPPTGPQKEPQKESALGRAASRLYLRLSEGLSCGGARLDTALAALDAQSLPAAKAAIKREVLPPVQRAGPLSANYRSLVIGAAMIAGMPLAIALFELVVLSIVMVWVRHAAARAIARAGDQLDAMSAR